MDGTISQMTPIDDFIGSGDATTNLQNNIDNIYTQGDNYFSTAQLDLGFERKVVSGPGEAWSTIIVTTLLTMWTVSANIELTILLRRMGKLTDPHYLIILVMSSLNSVIVIFSQWLCFMSKLVDSVVACQINNYVNRNQFNNYSNQHISLDIALLYIQNEVHLSLEHVLIVNIILREERTSLLLCQIYTVVSIHSYLSTVYVSGMLAMERYFYFCQPYKYERYFTIRKVTAAILILFLLVLAYVSIIEALFARKLFYAMPNCSVEEDDIISVCSVILVFLPVTITVIFAAIKLSSLIKKQKQQIRDMNYPSSNVTGHPLNFKMKSSLRQILMLSGLLFISQISVAIVCNILILCGVKRHDLETRKALVGFIVFRTSFLLSCFLAPASYPVVLLYVNRSLRQGLRGMFSKEKG